MRPVSPSMVATDSPFVLSLGTSPAGSLRVASFHGRERLSRPYAFDVLVTCHDGGTRLLHEAQGQPALFVIHGPSGSRAVRGIVARVRSAGARAQGQNAYSLRIVPRLWLRRHRKNSRIFQDMAVPEIVGAVLSEAGIPHRRETEHRYRPKSYCVQYEETDLDFIHRLLAEIGVFYWFEHAGDGTPVDAPELLLLGDRPRYQPIDGAPRLVHRVARPGVALRLKEHHVTAFERCLAAAPAAYTRRDHDFERPRHALTAGAGVKKGTPGAAEIPTEVYEHHGDFAEAEAEEGLETTALEQLRRKAERAEGRSHCPRLVVGRRFTLDEHEMEDHDGDYLVTGIEHDGRTAGATEDGAATYENRFSCVRAGSVLRPPHRPRQFRQVMETAVVSGPAGQEIYTDSFGRIKVQFHWDREGKNDERSSCWLRVAQAWSGAGWGFQFIPRIGMEVLVSFLGGDPDRPIVVGCVPDATHPPPYPLPENRATSGIKTESTPGGGGYNEILFNDEKGGELLSIRAEKNLTETALNDHLQSVGRDLLVLVAGERTTEIKGSDSIRVDGEQKHTIGGASSLSVGGRSDASHAGARVATVGGDDTLRVGGGHTVMAAAYSHLLIGHGEPEGHGLVYVNGNYRIAAAGALQMGASTSMTFSCGDSSIELLPDEIRIRAPKVTVTAADELLVKGKDNEIAASGHLEVRGKDIRLFAEEGQLLLDRNARLNGEAVKLNCDRPKPEKKEGDQQAEKGIILFRIEPAFPVEGGEPLVAVIATPDGRTLEMPVDASMEVRLEGKPGDRFVLLDVRRGDQSLSKQRSP